MTTETQEIWLLDFKPTVTRYERLPRRRNIVRRIATALAVIAGLLALSAGPADARPLIDQPDYQGPVDVHPTRDMGCTTVFLIEVCWW